MWNQDRAAEVQLSVGMDGMSVSTNYWKNTVRMNLQNVRKFPCKLPLEVWDEPPLQDTPKILVNGDVGPLDCASSKTGVTLGRG